MTAQVATNEVHSVVAPDHAATITRICELRSGDTPVDWPAVRRATKLKAGELRGYRWLIGAELFARGLGWKEIEAEPACGYKRGTLRTEHGKAKLPGGLSWDSYVNAYQDAMQARLLALQEARGEEAADQIHTIGMDVLANVRKLQDVITDQMNHPPFVIGGGQNAIFCTEKRPQLMIAFPGERLTPTEVDEPRRERLTLPFVRLLLNAQTEVVALLGNAQRVLVEKAPAVTGDAQDEDYLPTTPEELQNDLNASQALMDELTSYGVDIPEVASA